VDARYSASQGGERKKPAIPAARIGKPTDATGANNVSVDVPLDQYPFSLNDRDS